MERGTLLLSPDSIASHGGPGRFEGFEVKVNSAQRTPLQVLKDNLIAKEGGIVVSADSPYYGQRIYFGTGIVHVFSKP